jgi:hypothetical protein
MKNKWLPTDACIEMLEHLLTIEENWITQFLYDSIIFRLKEK